jgi:hypothetical protein
LGFQRNLWPDTVGRRWTDALGTPFCSHYGRSPDNRRPNGNDSCRDSMKQDRVKLQTWNRS